MIKALIDEAGLEEVLRQEHVMIYKHSPTCGISRRAMKHVEDFASRHPEQPVYWVDVVAHRSLSQDIALKLDIRHESPQAIVLKKGVPAWYGSHFRITRKMLEKKAVIGEVI